jgi:hypothetical protein
MLSADLNQNDFNSATWQKLRLHLEARLITLRARNDASMNAEDTARLRGQIAELKTLLALEDPAIQTIGASPLS